MKRFFALLMLIVGTTASAANTTPCRLTANPASSNPRNNSCAGPVDYKNQLGICGNIRVDAELLLWQAIACIDDYAFVIDPILTAGISGIKTPVASVAPSINLGLRVAARYDQDCWFADARYTWFQSADLDQIERDEPIIYAQGIAVSQALIRASTRIRYGYQDVNTRAGIQCLGNQCCQLYSWLEGRYAQIKVKRTVIGNGAFAGDPAGIIAEKATGTFDGGGLGIGFGIRAQILSCLQASTELSAVGLFGSYSGTYRRHGENQSADLTFPTIYPTKAAVVPGVGLRAKIEYIKTLCNLDFTLFFAWEIIEYWGGRLMTDPVIAPNDIAVPLPSLLGQVSGNRQCNNIGFGGPSVGFNVSY